MNVNDALTILEIPAGAVTPDDIKKAYRKAAAKYHPDHNPAGLEMMKLINVAYETLKEYEGQVTPNPHTKNYGEAINQALNAIINLGLTIEVCGAWVWVTGDTRPHKTTLKQAGFFWAANKLAWYFRPESPKCYRYRRNGSYSLGSIRAKYGSDAIKNKYPALLTH